MKTLIQPRNVIAALAFTVVAWWQVPRIPLMSAADAELVTGTAHISDPDRGGDIEFYEMYGIVFEADARGSGPICVERENILPRRRCITLVELRELIWSQP